MTTEKTFIKITNSDIYKKLIDIEKHVMRTNGKVKLNTWRSITALTITLSVTIGLLIKLII